MLAINAGLVWELGKRGGKGAVGANRIEDCLAAAGNVLLVLSQYAESPCVFSGQLFSGKILHTDHKRMVCILCVFLCE